MSNERIMMLRERSINGFPVYDFSAFKIYLSYENKYEVDDVEDGRILLYPLTLFDVDAVFQLNLNTSENNDWISLYIVWDESEPEDVEVVLCYANNTTNDGDFNGSVLLTNEQRRSVVDMLNSECALVYGGTMQELIAKERKEG